MKVIYKFPEGSGRENVESSVDIMATKYDVHVGDLVTFEKDSGKNPLPEWIIMHRQLHLDLYDNPVYLMLSVKLNDNS